MKKIILLIGMAGFCSCFAQGGWTKITAPSPVATFTSNGAYKGAAWVDINNDGLIDLFAMPDFLFLNSGSGNFTQLASTINPTPLQNPGGCSWGDINNDGFIDLITAQNPSEIYMNNGDTTFQNFSSTISGLNGFASWGCALADVNNDNRLDLLYAQAYGFHGSSTPYPCKLFYQDPSSFTFSPATGYAFTDSLKPYTVPYFDDYDMDGDMDLFIATGPGGSPGPDYCYRNMKMETGNDTLYKMIAEPWATQLQDGQCYNTIDTDNDGDLDLCLTNYGGASSRFYLNAGGGTYTQPAMPFVNTGNKLSNCWGDYDNDGDLDVMIASDNSALKYYVNNGNNNFVLQPGSINVLTGSSAIVNGDYDNDGDLDIFVHGQNTARSLWRNDTVAGNRHWINITLNGVISNRSAIGAFVKLKAIINGTPVWLLRHVTAQNSFQSQNDLRVHFGLNDAVVADSILICWPSGIKECYTNVAPDQFITYTEGNGIPVGAKEKAVGNDAIKIYPNPSNTEMHISFPGLKGSYILKLYDTAGALLFSDTVKDRSHTLPVHSLKTGYYFVLINYKGESFLKKVIIMQ